MQIRQKVAVIGSGAVGSYYGGRLAEAGHHVSFLVRRDYHAVSASGLNITSPDGDFVLPHPVVATHSEDIGQVDWIICALKATSIGDAEKLVQPCVGLNTRILVLMNGLGLEEYFAGWFGAGRIFGGLAFTCINRGRPGHIHHLAYGPVTIGHYKDDPAELEKATELWENSKTIIIPSPSLLRARWEKLCWNIPFSGIAVAAGGITTDIIMNTSYLNEAAHKLMNEVIASGNADLAHHSEAERIEGPDLVDRMFKYTATMGAYRPSTMIDYVEGQAMEIEAMFGEPLHRALSLNVSVPQLTLLTALLRSLNRNR